MKRKDIKRQVRQDKKKKLEINKQFYEDIAIYCINNELHIATIYKLVNVKDMAQMLDTMYEEIIEEYELHKLTIEKLKDPYIRESLNNEFERKGMKVKIWNLG